MPTVRELWTAYWLRLRRRRLLWRALRARHQLRRVSDRSSGIRHGDILAFATVRNEIRRLPHWLNHYRNLGVDHFLIVDNASDDGSAEFLTAQPDVSLWRTGASYRASRFGMDWLAWLMIRFGHNHWCLTVDADEILIYPDHESRPLPALTDWLTRQRAPMMAAMMLDMFPKGPLSQAVGAAGDEPACAPGWFDAQGYTWEYQQRYRNISIRGGVRKRVFFEAAPELAPHLHKTPLVFWSRRYVYASSTHLVLPRSLNSGFDTGVLLHGKFLDDIIAKSREEKHRREHFTHAARYDGYYDGIIADPDLWAPETVQFEGWQQLESLGLMTRGDWR